MSSQDLFIEEEQVITAAKELIESQLHNDNPMLKNFSSLCREYKKLYKMQKRLVRMSDKQLLQLNRLLRQIKMILDNIPVGIVIVDDNGIVQPSHSQYMHNLFDLKMISGMFIEDVLYLADPLEKERTTFKNWLKLVFDTSHDWELIGGLGPDLIEYETEKGVSYYRNNYHRIISEDKVTSLMIYIVDITERMNQKKIIQEQEAEHQFEMEIVSALLNQDDSNEILDYIYETKNMLNSSHKNFNTLAEEENKPPVYDKIFRLMHSIKGLSKTFGMNELARLAHHTEDILNQLRSNEITFETGLYEGELASEKISELIVKMTNLLKNSEKVLQKFFKGGKGTVAAIREQRRGIKVEPEKVETFVQLCEKISKNNPELSQELSEVTSSAKEFLLQPLSFIYERLRKIVNEVATVLDKEAELEITGDEILLAPETHHVLITSLIHLMRNALDHGIESIEDREASGKESSGKIKIRTSRSGGNATIIFEDDGAGINPDAIAEKALEKGLITSGEQAALDKDGKIKLVFSPGFSSKEDVNEISGRGVGLDVVNDAMIQLGGTVAIESEINVFTRFNLTFPTN